MKSSKRPTFTMQSRADGGTGSSDRLRDRQSNVPQMMEETVEVDHNIPPERRRETSR